MARDHEKGLRHNGAILKTSQSIQYQLIIFTERMEGGGTCKLRKMQSTYVSSECISQNESIYLSQKVPCSLCGTGLPRTKCFAFNACA